MEGIYLRIKVSISLRFGKNTACPAFIFMKFRPELVVSHVAYSTIEVNLLDLCPHLGPVHLPADLDMGL